MSSRWDLGWSKRAYKDGTPYFVVSFPAGSAIVEKNPRGMWNAHITLRNGDNRHSISMNDEFAAMTWAQDKIHEMTTQKVESSTSCRRSFTVKPKQRIRASIDPAEIADKGRITNGRYNSALQINWNVNSEDADRLINGRCNGEMCGSLPLKNSFVCVDYDNDGLAESKGYKRGFVVTDTSGHRLYYGICDDMNENIEYITMRRKK